jgi:hypothetical protein
MLSGTTKFDTIIQSHTGAPGTPSIIFGNDTTTGLYGSGSNTIGFCTANTERMTVTNNGLELGTTVYSSNTVSNSTSNISSITETTITTYRMADIYNYPCLFFMDFETSLLLENVGPLTLTNSGGITLTKLGGTLKAVYDFNVDVLTDESGNNMDFDTSVGTPTIVASYTGLPGKENILKLSKNTTQYLSLTDSTKISNIQNLTDFYISFWYTPPGFSLDFEVMSFHDGTTLATANNYIRFQSDSGSLTMYIGKDGVQEFTASIGPGNHYLIQFSTTNGLKAWNNNVNFVTAPGELNSLSTIPISKFIVGSEFGVGNRDTYFDTLVIVEGTPTDDIVDNLYNDRVSGNASSTGSDYLLSPTVDLSAITTSTGYTVGVNFTNFTNDATVEQCLFAMGDSDILPRLDIFLDNVGRIFIRELSSGGGTLFQASSAASGYTSAHILFTVENGVGNRFYIDGVEITPTYATGNASSEPLPSSLVTVSLFDQVTSGGSPNGNYSNCDMDDVFILGSSITGDEANILYNNRGGSNYINYTSIPAHNEVVYTSKLTCNDDFKFANGSQALYSTLQSDSYGYANWVGSKVIMRQHDTSTQSINDFSWTTMVTDETIFDSGDITQSSDVYTFPEAGVYLCQMDVHFANNATNIRAIRFLDSNNVERGRVDEQNNGAGTGVRLSTASIVYYDGIGTYTITPQVFQNSGGALALSGTTANPLKVSIVKLL